MNMSSVLVEYVTRRPGCSKADAIEAASNARSRQTARFALDDLIRSGEVFCEKDASGKTHLTVGAVMPTAPDLDTDPRSAL